MKRSESDNREQSPPKRFQANSIVSVPSSAAISGGGKTKIIESSLSSQSKPTTIISPPSSLIQKIQDFLPRMEEANMAIENRSPAPLSTRSYNSTSSSPISPHRNVVIDPEIKTLDNDDDDDDIDEEEMLKNMKNPYASKKPLIQVLGDADDNSEDEEDEEDGDSVAFSETSSVTSSDVSEDEDEDDEEEDGEEEEEGDEFDDETAEEAYMSAYQNDDDDDEEDDDIVINEPMYAVDKNDYKKTLAHDPSSQSIEMTIGIGLFDALGVDSNAVATAAAESSINSSLLNINIPMHTINEQFDDLNTDDESESIINGNNSSSLLIGGNDAENGRTSRKNLLDATTGRSSSVLLISKNHD